MKMELLTNATVIDDVIRFVAANTNNKDLVASKSFLAANIWAEIIQAKELENRRDLGHYIIFMCPLCQVLLDIKEKD